MWRPRGDSDSAGVGGGESALVTFRHVVLSALCELVAGGRWGTLLCGGIVAAVGVSSSGPVAYTFACAGLSHQAEGMQFFCQTCDYTYGLQGTVTKSIITEKKTKDDVLGGKEAWKNAPQANCTCLRVLPALVGASHTRLFGSKMSVLWKRHCILHANADSVSGRADDDVLHMHKVCKNVERLVCLTHIADGGTPGTRRADILLRGTDPQCINYAVHCNMQFI